MINNHHERAVNADSGNIEEAANLLKGRMRLEEVTEDSVNTASRLGHEVARYLVGVDKEVDWEAERVSLFQKLDRKTAVALALDCVDYLKPFFQEESLPSIEKAETIVKSWLADEAISKEDYEAVELELMGLSQDPMASSSVFLLYSTNSSANASVIAMTIIGLDHTEDTTHLQWVSKRIAQYLLKEL